MYSTAPTHNKLMCGLTDINNIRFGNENQYNSRYFSYLMQYEIQIFQRL